jgi:hypothetical protein
MLLSPGEINTFIIPVAEWHVTGIFPDVVYYAKKTNEWILSMDSVFYNGYPGAVWYGGQCCVNECQSCV